MSNPRKRTQKGGEKKEKKWDRGKRDLNEQFHFTLHIRTKRNVTSEFYFSHVKTYLYTWYYFISRNASVLVFMTANVMYILYTWTKHSLSIFIDRIVILESSIR